MTRALVALFVLLLQATPLLAKELYLTVRRDFGSAEMPQIELHYTSPAPLTIRVYRPKDLNEFVSTQLDLRRAWRKPRVEVNSAHYLLLGLNRTHLDLDWLRVSSSAELRNKLKEELGGSRWSPEPTPLVEGPTRLVAGPDRFDVVTELVFEPDEEDSRLPFDVPGFNWWFSREGNLRQRTATLPLLAPGFYLVQVLQGNLEGQVVLVVNDVQASVQQTDHAALVRVATRTSEPAAGASVEVRNLQGRFVASGRTNSDGVLAVSGLVDDELLLVVRHRDSTAIIDTDFLSTTAVFPDVYLYTDRPLYRRGSKVRFRGILREPSAGTSRLPAPVGEAREVALVSVVDLSGATIVREAEAPVSAFGTFEGELDLGSADLDGVYRLTARIREASHVGEFRVKEYVKPLFHLDVRPVQETLRAGGELSAEVTVARYSGGVPSGVGLSAQLFRVRSQTPQWVEDSGLAETGSMTTYGRDTRRESVAVPFPVAGTDDITFDANGKAHISLRLPEVLPGPPNYDYEFVLRLFARDSDGNVASASRSFPDARSEVVALARFSSVYAAPDRPATLAVRAVYPSGKPYGRSRGLVRWTLTPFQRGTIVREESFTTGDDGEWRTRVSTSDPGQLQALVTLEDRAGRPTSSEATLVVASRVPGAPLVDVAEMTLHQEGDTFAPGDVARALVMLPEGWGEKGGNRGRLHLTVAGRTIHEHRVQTVEGLSAWIEQPIRPEYGTAAYAIVSYPDPTQGWVERTLTLRVPPNAKTLRVSVAARKAFVRPGEVQGLSLRLTDSSGQPVRGELSVSVVDKSVLALQPEFRPSLLAFFHPFERLNVMSFFSREFQAYGYGERLAARFRPNFWMAAAKPDRKPKEEDTAYWNGKVETDADGLASVEFELPSNQTTWSVSAVAVDTRGRFGEGRTSFGTSSPVTVSLSAPPFLRQGDRAEVRLRLSNTTRGARQVKARVDAEGGLVGSPLSLDTSVVAGGETAVQGQITLDGVASGGATALRTSLEYDQESLRFRHPLRTLPGTVSTIERRPLRPGEAILTSPAERAHVSAVRIVAGSRLAAALAPALRYMLEYPFGCAEQVASVTAVSLAARSLLLDPPVGAGPTQVREPVVRRSVPAAPRPAADVFADASAFSSAGLARLASLRNGDGSYSWWPGSGKGDATMTALVLTLVTSTEDPEPARNLGAVRSLGWLRSVVDEQEGSLPVTLSFIASRLRVLGLLEEPGHSMEAILRFQCDWALSSGSLLDQSLLLLALDAYGLGAASGFDRLEHHLLARVEASVTPMLSRNSASRTSKSSETWTGYPGRLPSTLAIAAHALQVHGRLDEDATARLSRALLEAFDGRHFGSTFETAQILTHTAWLLRAEMRSPGAPPAVRVKVGNRVLSEASLTRTPAAFGVEIQVDASEASKGALRVETGDKELAVDAVIEREIPFHDARAWESGWELERTYYRLDPKSGERTPLSGPLSVGDLVYVQLTFSPRHGGSPFGGSSYYLLSDEIAAGLAVVEQDRSFDAPPFGLRLHDAGYALRSIRTDRIQWFFAFERRWMDQAVQTGYVLRAHHAGEFSSGVARIQDFYDESLASQTAPRRISVSAPEPTGH